MGVLDYSTTPGSNIAINSIDIQGSAAVQNFDNAFRQMMADVASQVTRQVTKSANYTALKADHKQLIEFTAAATLSLTTASTLTNGWMCIVKANGGAVTIDPASSETIDGAATKTVADGNAAWVYCNGTSFLTITTSSAIAGLTPTDGNIIVGNGATWVAESGATARTSLGLAIGTDVQAHDAGLDDIAGLAVTDGNFIVADGTNWIAESGGTARASLGLGSIATQAASSVSITGGSISGITDLPIADGGTGASSASAAFSNLKQAATTSATGVVELATVAEFRSDAAGDLALTSEKVWDAVDPVALTDAPTISWVMSAGIDRSVTIGGNRTLGNPTSTTVGKKGRIKVTASGADRTLDKGSNIKSVTTFPITISSGASAYLYYDCVSSTEIVVSVVNGAS